MSGKEGELVRGEATPVGCEVHIKLVTCVFYRLRGLQASDQYLILLNEFVSRKEAVLGITVCRGPFLFPPSSNRFAARTSRTSGACTAHGNLKRPYLSTSASVVEAWASHFSYTFSCPILATRLSDSLRPAVRSCCFSGGSPGGLKKMLCLTPGQC